MGSSLCIEREEAPIPIIRGNRIVELGYVIDRILHLQYEHIKICTLGKLSVEEELRKNLGLVSSINLKCTMCERKYVICTEDPKRNVSLINTGAVWGTLATGSTHTHLSELLSCMDVPQMPASMFNKIETNLGEVNLSTLVDERSMKVLFYFAGMEKFVVEIYGSSWCERKRKCHRKE